MDTRERVALRARVKGREICCELKGEGEDLEPFHSSSSSLPATADVKDSEWSLRQLISSLQNQDVSVIRWRELPFFDI